MSNADLEFERYRQSLRNPFPPPDRRYRLARRYVADGVSPSYFRDDKEIWEIFKFLRAKQTYWHTKDRVRKVLLRFPDLACAFKLHHGEARSARAIIEAYLLANAAPGDIAAEMRVNEEAIKWFRFAFFDVEPYLPHRLYVWTRLIGIVGNHGHKALDEPTLWKLVGYVYGPARLSQLLHGGQGFGGGNAESVEDLLDELIESTLKVKQLLAVNQLRPDDNEHISALLRLVGQGRRARGQTADEPLNPIKDHIEAMLKELPWTCSSEHVPAALQDWQQTAAELNSDEEMLLAAGQQVSGIDELKDLQFPLRPGSTSSNTDNT